MAGSTDERTLIAALHPRVGAGHTLPQIVSCGSLVRRRFALTQCFMNTFACDYVSRQKVGRAHVALFVLKQIPLVGLDTQGVCRWVEPIALELCFTAWDMASLARDLGYSGPPFRWNDERRARLRVELDALMFHLCGIHRADTTYVLDTFPIVRRKDEQQYGEYRTKHRILDRYDAMMNAYEASHGTLDDTPNGRNPPLVERTLATYSKKLAEALYRSYESNVSPPPADPSCAHPESTRPSWAS